MREAKRELELIMQDPDVFIKKTKEGAVNKSTPDFYTFKDRSTVEMGKFDTTGSGDGAIRRPDGSLHNGKFVKGEFIQGNITSKTGDKFIFDKNAKVPLMRESDNRTLGKILSHESIRGEIPTMKWTHRTTVDALEQILNSGKIITKSDRGVNFWGGLGAGYGDISLIMKKGVENIKEAGGIEDVKKVYGGGVKSKDNMVYFFGNQSKGNGMTMEQYSQKFGDFTDARAIKGENPHVNDPYLMVGEESHNGGYEVGADLIEAVIIPTHVKNYPNYPQIKSTLEARGIQIIEAQTSPSILNYSGGSLLNVVAGGRSDKGLYAQTIKAELKKLYPRLSPENAAIAHLKSTGAIPENSTKTFQEHLDVYNNIANRDGLSRGSSNGGEFENYASHKNHANEQQSYFNYLIESKYRNFSEMPPKELSSLLEGYLSMPELLKQKIISPKDIQGLISELRGKEGIVADIIRRRSTHEDILNRLVA